MPRSRPACSLGRLALMALPLVWRTGSPGRLYASFQARPFHSFHKLKLSHSLQLKLNLSFGIFKCGILIQQVNAGLPIAQKSLTMCGVDEKPVSTMLNLW